MQLKIIHFYLRHVWVIRHTILPSKLLAPNSYPYWVLVFNSHSNHYYLKFTEEETPADVQHLSPNHPEHQW